MSAAALAAVFAICLPLGAEQRSATAEDDIKATFLFNFTKYVEWPGDLHDPFRLCVVAEPAFAAAVDRVVAGESAGGRAIVRISPETSDAARACQILFIGRLETDRASRWIATLHDAPVLIVSESKSAWQRGSHINFVLEDNRVKFDVNIDAASGTGLTISSKLLRVARQITARGGA